MQPRDTQPVGLLTRHLGLKGCPATFANSRVPSAARPGATERRSPCPAKLLRLSVLVRTCSRLSWANTGKATVCFTFQGTARCFPPRRPTSWPPASRWLWFTFRRRLETPGISSWADRLFAPSGESVRLGSLPGGSALASGAVPVLCTFRTAPLPSSAPGTRPPRLRAATPLPRRCCVGRRSVRPRSRPTRPAFLCSPVLLASRPGGPWDSRSQTPTPVFTPESSFKPRT